MYAIADLVKELDGIDCTIDPMKIRAKSRDRYAVSPLLRQMLKDKRADVLISPASVDEVLRVVRAAVRLRIPITERGGGTANYGQSAPLPAALLLDITRLTGIRPPNPAVLH